MAIYCSAVFFSLTAVWVCAELVIKDTSSIFYVDGLLADGLETSEGREEGFFHAEIKKKPLIRPRAPRSSLMHRRVSPGIRMAPRGRAAEYLKAAGVYARSENWKMALASIQRGLDAEPNNMMLVRRAAAYAALARKFGAADEYFRRAIEADPNDVAFLSGRAGILVRLLRLDDAEELLDRALELDDDYLAARFNKACIAVARGEQVDAEEWRTISAGQAAELANWLDADQQDYIAALSASGFETLCATLLAPGSHEHLRKIVDTMRHARTAMRKGHWEEAEKTLLAGMELGMNREGIQADLARCRFEQGRVDEAEQMLRGLAAACSNSVLMQYNYAYILISEGKFKESAKVLESAKQLEKSGPQVDFALACSYAGMNEMDKAWPILVDLADQHADELRDWLTGNESYLKTIRKDPRFKRLMRGRNTKKTNAET